MTHAVHRGEIWWADVAGDKRRPVLVMTRERFVARLRSLSVAPLTTTVRGIPTELPLGPAEGLPTACAANFDNVFTIDRSRLVERITQLDAQLMAAACRAHRFAVGC
jgi:mRNA interferase MazF